MSAATITFGDCAENHVGMQKLGAPAAAGLTCRDLLLARDRFAAAGAECEIVDLVAEAGVDGSETPAEVLVVRDGVNVLLGRNDLDREHAALEPDKRALMRGRVVNKLARHNLCFADAAQEPDYAAGRGRVVAFDSVPWTAAARAALPEFFGPKAANLLAESNYYYDVAKCGIGFHGDTERRIVIALRLGGAPIPLHFQWFLRGRPVGERVALDLQPGDLYAMSEKAVGSDWKRASVPTLRHAAGAQKYLTVG
jgi:hypothetical protein